MRLKILALSYLFPNPAQPGYGIFVYNRLQAVQEFCDIRVIAPVQWYPFIKRIRPGMAYCPDNAEFQKFAGLQVAYPRFLVIPRYFKWFDSAAYLVAAWRVFLKLRRAGFRVDLIDIHWTYPDILAAYVLAKLLDKPFLVTIRGREALCLGEKGGRKKLLDSLLRKADGVIALSSELKDLVIKIGVQPERVKVILNGVNPDTFAIIEKKKARERLGLPHGKQIIISIGRFTFGKGHHELIGMMPDLLQTHDLELFIIGGINPESDFSQELRDLIARLELTSVHLVDTVPHSALTDWYAAADLFCLATQGEGCPNVVLEALACGTPVVVTNVGAVPDIVDSGRDGFVVRTMPEMKEKIEEGLTMDWDRESIAAKMRRRTWRTCAEEVVENYRSVLKNGNSLTLQEQE